MFFLLLTLYDFLCMKYQTKDIIEIFVKYKIILGK